VIEAFDHDLDRGTRQRQVALVLIDGENAFALASQVDENALAADAVNLAGAEARGDCPGRVRARHRQVCWNGRSPALPRRRLPDRTRPSRPRARLQAPVPLVA